MLRIIITAFTILVCTFFAGRVIAQDAAETLLPEIDPQDIEIRSQFQARFPGLRRQPILGFNPRPRVFQLDPNRMPFIESQEAVAASLPVGQLDRPAPPVYQPLPYSNPKRGFARVGAGSYFSPEADVVGIASLGDKGWISPSLNYISTDGHDEENNSSFRFLDAGLHSQIKLSSNKNIKLGAGFESNFNYLPDFFNVVAQSKIPGDRKMNGTLFHFSSKLTHHQTSVSGYDLHLNGFYSELSPDIEQSTLTDAIDSGVEFGGSYTWIGNKIDETLSINGNFQLGGQDLDFQSDSWLVSSLMAGYNRIFDQSTKVDIKAGASFVDDAPGGSVLYAAADANASHQLLNGLIVKAHVRAMPGFSTFSDHQKVNRFLTFNSLLQHTYEIDLGGQIVAEPVNGTKIYGGASYRDIQNYASYRRDELLSVFGDMILGNYFIDQQDATFVEIDGGITQTLSPQKLWFQGDVYWQRPRLSGGEKIPFIESIGAEGSISYRPIGELTLEASAGWVGSRQNPHGSDLSSYVLANAGFEIAITERAGIYAKIVNLFDQQYERWQGYQERGFQGYAGITFLF